jgi:hypothetical protein
MPPCLRPQLSKFSMPARWQPARLLHCGGATSGVSGFKVSYARLINRCGSWRSSSSSVPSSFHESLRSHGSGQGLLPDRGVDSLTPMFRKRAHCFASFFMVVQRDNLPRHRRAASERVAIHRGRALWSFYQSGSTSLCVSCVVGVVICNFGP